MNSSSDSRLFLIISEGGAWGYACLHFVGFLLSLLQLFRHIHNNFTKHSFTASIPPFPSPNLPSTFTNSNRCSKWRINKKESTNITIALHVLVPIPLFMRGCLMVVFLLSQKVSTEAEITPIGNFLTGLPAYIFFTVNSLVLLFCCLFYYEVLLKLNKLSFIRKLKRWYLTFNILLYSFYAVPVTLSFISYYVLHDSKLNKLSIIIDDAYALFLSIVATMGYILYWVMQCSIDTVSPSTEKQLKRLRILIYVLLIANLSRFVIFFSLMVRLFEETSLLATDTIQFICGLLSELFPAMAILWVLKPHKKKTLQEEEEVKFSKSYQTIPEIVPTD